MKWFVICMVLMLAPAALACSCVQPRPVLEEFADSTAVFAGKVTGIDVPGGLFQGSADPVKITFDVSRVWKGDVTEATAITTARDSASCGHPFMVGEEYLVYAYGSPLETNICTRTKLISEAGEDLALLGQRQPPLYEEPVHPSRYIYVLLALGGLFIIWILLRVLKKH